MAALSAPEKTRLNELVRMGCHVRASHHDGELIRVSVRFRENLVAESSGSQLDQVFGEACAHTHQAMFGMGASPLRG